MTDEEIRVVLEEADAGPWWFDGRDIFHKQPETNLDQIILPIPSAEETFHPSQAVNPATAKLASWAPVLAKEVLELRARVARLRAVITPPAPVWDPESSECMCDTVEEGWRPCPESLCERPDHYHEDRAPA